MTFKMYTGTKVGEGIQISFGGSYNVDRAVVKRNTSRKKVKRYSKNRKKKRKYYGHGI